MFDIEIKFAQQGILFVLRVLLYFILNLYFRFLFLSISLSNLNFVYNMIL